MARKVELIKVTLEDIKDNNGKEVVLDYREQYLGILRKPVNGMALDTMEICIRAITKLKNASEKDMVVLEEDEWGILSNLIKDNKWALICPEVFGMIKNVTEAKQTSLELVASK